MLYLSGVTGGWLKARVLHSLCFYQNMHMITAVPGVRHEEMTHTIGEAFGVCSAQRRKSLIMRASRPQSALLSLIFLLLIIADTTWLIVEAR